ncbi:MAG: hypothetical protein D8M57_10680 [Candidatus Scalindua sp. AMX11]|nr:MAG: hypothetical protein DWQ00_03325 [Candidatus Scalindua sp.]NOG83130.1 hypothetical protein [Planctomycetota bacterium]RZV75854.1 MAG: hypothetical protein EX341_12455 [Candidatus Scalindua sp. SCAELEC01]TDE64913.1 MAG: hypothetical protein D8M57_10680 [Candidatus Scalindua sp. AMX11]GJQ60241.1 MAG: hypothetical protein SCALA701_30420 [Candidatus Scalindua sp.]
MDWLFVGIAVGFGVLVTGVAFLVIRKRRERWWLYTLVLFFSCVISYVTMSLFVTPTSEREKSLSELEVSLSEIPAYKQISMYDAETYQRINAEIQKSLLKGESKSQIIQRIRSIVGELVEKYLPLSSDNALLDYMNVVIQEIEELAQQSPELCYKFLFPKQYGAIDVTKYIRPETQQADLNALAAVIKTGAESSTNVQDFPEYDAFIQNIIINLHETYGDDALLLENPHAPGIDKRKFCRIMVALYREILKLPKRESCLVLRSMLTTK